MLSSDKVDFHLQGSSVKPGRLKFLQGLIGPFSHCVSITVTDTAGSTDRMAYPIDYSNPPSSQTRSSLVLYIANGKSYLSDQTIQFETNLWKSDSNLFWNHLCMWFENQIWGWKFGQVWMAIISSVLQVWVRERNKATGQLSQKMFRGAAESAFCDTWRPSVYSSERHTQKSLLIQFGLRSFYVSESWINFLWAVFNIFHVNI